ncbi:MAG: hypothetical protein KDB58_02290 [Solirubrobacterales bacterium]|nr:hypothetical protein [Solirubrobacterales bacterium]MCB8971459.1 hypothetical protein [Thermoleophilales bacterium]MCO5327129.1 hypothetical protein [Solirubrobacterales bacterium]
MPGRRYFEAVTATGVLLLTLLAAACGGSDSTSGGADDDSSAPFAAAVEGVSIPPGEAVSVQWADTARLREAAGLSESAEDAVGDERWQVPVGYAFGDQIATQYFAVDFGFNPVAGERTLGLGVAPKRATLYEGVDTDAAREAFADLGFEDEGEFLASGEEGSVGLDPGNADASGALIGINRVGTEGEDLAIGAYEAPVAAALGREGDPLADVDGIAATADCLGPEALAAQVDEPQDGAAADAVALQAVGISEPDESDVVPEVVCAVGAPGESLDDVAACMDASFNDGGVDPVTNRAYEDELGPAQMADGEAGGSSWVRATFEPPAKDPVGRVFDLALRSALAGPLGGDPLAAVGASATPQKLKELQQQIPDAC